MNNVNCECGVEFDEQNIQIHQQSSGHRKYFNLKKSFQEALSKPVVPGVAS